MFDAKTVMSGGFEMGNMWYNEPKTIDTACDVLGDIIMMAASQQYGGLTIPEVDKLLSPYVEKSVNMYKDEILNDIQTCCGYTYIDSIFILQKAKEKAKRDLAQGIQGLEYKLNSVASSRGDYPFVTFTFGEDMENEYSVMVSEVLLDVRKNGQGKKGHKKNVLFPKLVFLYVEDYHGKDKTYEFLFDKAIDCSSIAMYPDYLSLTGDGYVASIYKKYKKIISPMG